MNVSRFATIVVMCLLTPLTFAAELVEVPIGISPVMSSAGVYIAVAKGYFEQEGIKPKLIAFDGSGAKMVPALASGDLFVAGGNINAGMYNAISNDIPIKIVADKGTVSPGHGYLALLVRKDLVDSGRYKNYADLKGMTMAVTAKGVSQEIVTEMYLKKAGLSLKDINLVPLAYKDMNIAFANKSLDATVQIEPLVTAAVEQGFAVRIEGNDLIYPNQQSAALFYSPMFMEKYPDLATGFMIAYVKALRDYNDAFDKNKGKVELIELLVKAGALKDAATGAKMTPVGLHPDGKLNIASLKNDAQWFKDKAYVESLPNMDNVVDQNYVEHAVRVLGPYQ